MKAIPYGKQLITNEDIKAVVETLESDFLTQGPKVAEFEQKFSEFTGSRYAVAVSNGTAALHLSVLVLNIKPGDKVITTPITFAASANCVLYVGGEVDFVDIDKETYLIDLNQIEDKLKKDKKGKYKCIIPVDFAGYPVNMEELKILSEKFNCHIIEDSCHAPGGYFVDNAGNKQFCGNGTFPDLSIFSFHPVKHVATGEGGMITTNNKKLYESLTLYRTHGITKNPDKLTQNPGGWYYEMQVLGYNYRITDIQCALGISQLRRVHGNLHRRREIAEKYDKAFKKHNYIMTPVVRNGVGHAYHLYIIQISDRKSLYDYLRQRNIYSQVHYIPVHLLPFYQKFGWSKGDFPVAEEYYNNCLSLPIYPSLSEKEQDYVIDTILDYYEKVNY